MPPVAPSRLSPVRNPRVWSLLLWLPVVTPTQSAPDLMEAFARDVQPLLDEYCFDCHGFGASKGGLTLDQFKSETELKANPALWLRVLKKTRAGLMPPAEEAQPPAESIAALGTWITHGVFGLDPARQDPGHVTLRRLNQFEYRNTIRDLTGVDYKTDVEFPPDDTGEGFDVIGEALNISPMLLEKYFDAAQQIVTEAVGLDGFKAFAPPGLPAVLPAGATQRADHVRALLTHFTTRAYRRPAAAGDIDRLVELTHRFSSTTGEVDAAGLTQALVAVLASPRFIFRLEQAVPAPAAEAYPLIDEYALASRLSFLFWSTGPDEELLALAASGGLRAALDGQVARMLADPKGGRFVENFAGQWLHARAVETTPINDFDIFIQEGGAPGMPEAKRTMRELQGIPAFRQTPEQSARLDAALKLATESFELPRPRLTGALRKAMRRETEMHFAHLLAENRSVLELLDCDYTFLNGPLADYYGIPGVTGSEMRKVRLPEGSRRGGVLTQGTFLVTTSNPGRTSPVKRGIYILENILGSPPAPPPPDIPALEDAASKDDLTRMTLRETLAAHRANSLCSSCHNAMDPLGLAFENFNPMGRWRDHEKQQSIQPAGRLVTGEEFQDVAGLKQILVTRHRRDFYHCLSEKLLTYALGRSLTHLDTLTLDGLVAVLEQNDGRLSPLINAVVRSVPFQHMRAPSRSAAIAHVSTPHPKP